jgi:hypothetical protein
MRNAHRVHQAIARCRPGHAARPGPHGDSAVACKRPTSDVLPAAKNPEWRFRRFAMHRHRVSRSVRLNFGSCAFEEVDAVLDAIGKGIWHAGPPNRVSPRRVFFPCGPSGNEMNGVRTVGRVLRVLVAARAMLSDPRHIAPI